MQTPNFRVTVVQDADTVEICGALKVGELLTGLCRSWLAEPVIPYGPAGRSGQEADSRVNPSGYCTVAH